MFSKERTRKLIQIEAKFLSEGGENCPFSEKMHFACRDADKALGFFLSKFPRKILVELRVYTIGKVYLSEE